ncbi:condensation domain-containing protein [Kitasatospora sp. NPDC058170]|uniref:condensation domain-containing protein n=1 Tax=Kitasatospora sp. NPDC058170 TaxID=3346364 RepID=UPI0036DEFA0E
MNTAPQHIPLSVGQQAMWVAWKRDPAQWTHIIPTPFLVQGRIDPDRLARAVRVVGRAWPHLRGRVAEHGGRPVLDWSGAPEIPVRESHTEEAREEAARRTWQSPFDLRTGPLARVDLLHCPDGTVLLLAVHHLVYDGASILLLLDALRRAYADLQPLPEAPTGPSAAYAERSGELADGPAGDGHRAYWREALDGGARDFRLPAGTERPQYTVVAQTLPADLAARLRERAAQLGISYTAVLLGGYFALLSRCTGSAEPLAFVPYHGRSDAALRDSVGYFVNTLPVRCRVGGSDSYAQLLPRAYRRLKEALSHGDLPLPAIMRAAGLTGPQAQASTHQTVFQLWDATTRDGVDVQRVRLTGPDTDAVLSLQPMESTAGFTLAAMVRKDSAGTHLLWKDPQGACGPTLVSAMVDDYVRILRDIADDPGTAVAATPVRATGAVRAAGDFGNGGQETDGQGDGGPGVDATGLDTATLAAVTAIWEEVLGFGPIRTEDSFFELGGHSLLADALVARVCEQFGTDLSLKTLFDSPRLGEFTAEVQRAAETAGAGAAAPEPQADPEPGPSDGWAALPHRMSLGVRRGDLVGGSAPVSVICKVFRFAGASVDPARLERAVALAVRVNPALRSGYRDDPAAGPQYREEPWTPTLDLVDLGDADWDGLCAAARRIADRELAEAGPAEAGPDGDGRRRHLRVVCVRRTEPGFAVVLRIDHAVCDGLSYTRFLEDVGAAYTAGEEAFLRTRDRPSLAAVAAAERRVLDSDHTRDLLDLWRKRLPTGVPPVLLGDDSPWPAGPVPAASVPFTVGGEAYRRHTEQARRHRVTSFVLAGAKVLHAMRPSVRNEELAFYCPFPGRYVPEAGEVMGNFVNLLPVLVDTPREGSLEATVQAVHEGVRWALIHQNVPSDRVTEALRGVGRPGADPAVPARALFLAGNPPEAFTLGGRTGEAGLPELDRALFDLSLWVTDTGRELRGLVVHRRDLISRPQVEEWLSALHEPVRPPTGH